MLRDPMEALQRHFGFSSLREGQDKVVQAILEGRDTLVVMPTGGGKSLCYQLPALCREGITLVVSPLIALMKDQVDALTQKGIPATMINSTLSGTEQRERISRMRQGDFKLVYIAPERFGHASFMNAMVEMDIDLVAIDEAHCLSQWGHDFRPDYLKIGQAIERLNNPQVAALTATATPRVRDDILTHLRLQDPEVIVRGFARDNLHFGIAPCDSHKEKYRRLHELVSRHRTGIVYCSTRKKVDQVYADLADTGARVVAYHAGMSDEDREQAQNRFISGDADVAVATNAFGMGIDRADVRFVAHFEIPGSLEAYYQEAGRAGRDGEDAWCELLFNHADLRTQEFFIEGANPPLSVITDLYNLIRSHCNPETRELLWSVEDMASRLQCKNEMSVGSALAALMRCRAIERFDVPGQRIKGTRLCDPDLKGADLPIDAEGLREKELRDREKLKAVTEFAYSAGCRQQWILNYFGETDSQPCGRCDQCRELGAAPDEALSGEEIEIMRKALSGVARASGRNPDGSWRGRWGRVKIIQMLKGSQNKDIINTSLCGLSTYGLLKHLSEDAIKQLFQSFRLSGYLKVDGGEIPLLTLSPKGVEVMSGKLEPRLIWPLPRRGAPVRRAKGATPQADGLTATIAPLDEELLGLLKQLRKDLASDAGIPPYVVFHNATLEALARIKPTTREAAMRIHGIGSRKASMYLDDFLELIAEHEGV